MTRTFHALLALLLLLGGCAGNAGFKEGRNLIAAGRGEEGLALLEQSVREFPADREARAFYYSQRAIAVAKWSAAAEEARRAGRLEEAEAGWRRVQRAEPANPRAPAGLAEIAASRRRLALLSEAEALARKGDASGAETRLRTILAEDAAHEGAKALLTRLQEQEAKNRVQEPALGARFAKPITLDFRETPLKTVLEVLSRTAGLNFVMDKDVRADTRITIFVRNTGIGEVLRLIMATNQLQHRVIGENSVLIYPAMGAKTKEYQETVTRGFYLANIEAKQAVNLFKTITKTRDIYVDEKLNLVILRDTPEAVRLAERLIEAADLAEPEVMLEIEVLELTRSRLRDLGVSFPDQIGYGLLQPQTSTTVVTNAGYSTSTNLGGTLAQGMVDLHQRGGLTSYVANPALLLNLKNQVGDGNLLANPRIRVKNREKAKVHIGEKLPVFTTTATANVGLSAAVSYLDVGLKLDVEPTVHLENDVDIKVGLEVSSIVKEVMGPSNSLAYQVGTRSASTVLRLKDGETQVLAGLINDEERSSANRLPGLGDLPFLGRLFSTQRDSHNKTEIVLLVTPRVVRNIVRPPLVSATLPAGTDTAIGAPPLTVTSPGGISLSSTPSSSAPAMSAPPAPMAPPAPTAPAGAQPPQAPQAPEGQEPAESDSGEPQS